MTKMSGVTGMNEMTKVTGVTSDTWMNSTWGDLDDWDD